MSELTKECVEGMLRSLEGHGSLSRAGEMALCRDLLAAWEENESQTDSLAVVAGMSRQLRLAETENARLTGELKKYDEFSTVTESDGTQWRGDVAAITLVTKLERELAEERELLDYIPTLTTFYVRKPTNDHEWRVIETDCGAMRLCGEGETFRAALRAALDAAKGADHA